MNFSTFFNMASSTGDLEERLTGRILQNIGIALLNSPVLQRTLQSGDQNLHTSFDSSLITSKDDDDLNLLFHVCALFYFKISYY